MRAITVSGTLLLAGLGWIIPAEAQPPVPPKENPAPSKGKDAARLDSLSLDEMLALALQNNADLRVAEAKIRDAQAERDRLRLQIINKVRSQKAAVEAQREAVGAVQKIADTFLKLRGQRASSDFESLQVEKSLADAKLKLAEVEAELPYLLGQGADGKSAGASGTTCARFTRVGMVAQECTTCHTTANARQPHFLEFSRAQVLTTLDRFSAPHLPVRPEMADKIKAALDRTVRLDTPIKSSPVTDVLEALRDGQDADKKLSGKGSADQPIAVRSAFGDNPPLPVSVPAGSLPLGAWLQMIEDSSDYVFLVRDYGILVTRKAGPNGQGLPPGAVTATEFWKTYGRQPLTPDKK